MSQPPSDADASTPHSTPSIDRRAFLRATAAVSVGAPLMSTAGCAIFIEPVALHAAHAAVAADHEAASRAGADVLAEGGNAVDAAIATNIALAVVRPYSCGLGGGGFWVVHDEIEDRSHAFDARERAPLGVDANTYVRLRDETGRRDASRDGATAVAVPHTIPGLVTLHARFGSMPWRRLVEPGAALARDGFAVDADHVGAVRSLAARREADSAFRSESAWVWENLCASGSIRAGDMLAQPTLAAFLERLALRGIDAWHADDTVRAIEGVIADGGGFVEARALRAAAPTERAPIEHAVAGAFGEATDVTFITMPPPSSGGAALVTTIELLRRAIARTNAPISIDHPLTRHLLVESMRIAFADRSRTMADPDFATVDVAAMLDPARLDRLAAAIDPERARPSAELALIDPLAIDGGTSHFSIVDGRGMAVACTETINTHFGSGVAVPELGIVLNNEMDDFTAFPGEPNVYGLVQSPRNAPEPGKRPLSSMTPTIVLDGNRRVRAVAGASGGPRIITGTTQVLLRMLVEDAGVVRAVNAPRIHQQWLPDVVGLEPPIAEGAVASQLRARGHEVREVTSVGVVQAIKVQGGNVTAESDRRKGGRPALVPPIRV